MSQIYTRIRDDIKKSMKEKNGETITLRGIDSAIQLKAKELRDGIDDGIVLDVITKAIKQRMDSIDAFIKGARHDLVAKEVAEGKILNRYLPEQLTDDELDAIITAALIATDAQSIKDMGKVMGFVIKQTKGKADNGKISKIIKEKLMI